MRYIEYIHTDMGDSELIQVRSQAPNTATLVYRETVEPHYAAMRMIRDAIGELFGPVASIESDDATLLRGPEPHHDADAVIEALQRVKARG